MNQTFTVTYTDGTTAKFTQSISDWAAPQNFFGETTAATTAYRDRSNGLRKPAVSMFTRYVPTEFLQDDQQHHTPHRRQRRDTGGHAPSLDPSASQSQPLPGV